MIGSLKRFRRDLRELVDAYSRDNDRTHRLPHAIDVAENSAEIYKLLYKYNRKTLKECSWFSDDSFNHELVIEIIAMIHDTIDHKFKTKEQVDQTIEEYRTFFESYSLTETEINVILDTIQNMSYSQEKREGYPHFLDQYSLIRDIVCDADRIEALGKMGIIRCYEYRMWKFPNMCFAESTKKIVEHCHEKLTTLREKFIKTIPGKRLSSKKHKYILNYISLCGQDKINSMEDLPKEEEVNLE